MLGTCFHVALTVGALFMEKRHVKFLKGGVHAPVLFDAAKEGEVGNVGHQ